MRLTRADVEGVGVDRPLRADEDVPVSATRAPGRHLAQPSGRQGSEGQSSTPLQIHSSHTDLAFHHPAQEHARAIAMETALAGAAMLVVVIREAARRKGRSPRAGSSRNG